MDDRSSHLQPTYVALEPMVVPAVAVHSQRFFSAQRQPCDERVEGVPIAFPDGSRELANLLRILECFWIRHVLSSTTREFLSCGRPCPAGNALNATNTYRLNGFCGRMIPLESATVHFLRFDLLAVVRLKLQIETKSIGASGVSMRSGFWRGLFVAEQAGEELPSSATTT